MTPQQYSLIITKWLIPNLAYSKYLTAHCSVENESYPLNEESLITKPVLCPVITSVFCNFFLSQSKTIGSHPERFSFWCGGILLVSLFFFSRCFGFPVTRPESTTCERLLAHADSVISLSRERGSRGEFAAPHPKFAHVWRSCVEQQLAGLGQSCETLGG